MLALKLQEVILGPVVITCLSPRVPLDRECAIVSRLLSPLQPGPVERREVAFNQRSSFLGVAVCCGQFGFELFSSVESLQICELVIECRVELVSISINDGPMRSLGNVVGDLAVEH